MYGAKTSFDFRASDADNEPLSGVHYETIVIERGVKKAQTLCEQDLHAFCAETASNQSGPTLKLVTVQSQSPAGRGVRAGGMSLYLKHSDFDKLFDWLQANPWVLRLISSRYDGYHHSNARAGCADTYFFGFTAYAMLWTFSPTTACTKVLCITRRPSRYQQVHSMLGSYASLLVTPYVPLVATCTEVTLEFDQRLDRHANRIEYVELGTGFAYQSTAVTAVDVEQLARWSRISASTQINIINHLRHDDNCMRALETIQRQHPDDALSQSLDENIGDEYKRSMHDILDAIDTLKMRSGSFVTYATYLKNRAEAQITVIFALLTHEDSTSNLKAAEASMESAAAAKRDSSAMKTIAFMTMAFLPATFLAALFAVPFLEWGHKIHIEMNGFELYWTVAILSTAFIFVVRAFVTHWGHLLERAVKCRKDHKRRK